MPDINAMTSLAQECGFSRVGRLNMDALEFLPEVRDMCAADRCNKYGKSWTCPPGCGSLEEITQRAAGYAQGIIVQTVAETEDDFDYEAMEAAGKTHRENFLKMNDRVAELSGADILPMGAGGCSLCEKCAYPDDKCRFPNRAFPSMEAYGLFVSKVCEKSGVPYYSGKNTITYTSCFLFK